MIAIPLVVRQLSGFTSSSPPNSASFVVKCSRKDHRVQAAPVYKDSRVAACPFPLDLGKLLATVSSINNTPSSLITLSLSPTGANRGQPGITTGTFVIHSTLNSVQYGIRSFNDAPNFEQYVHYHFTIDNTSKKLFQICGMHEIKFQRDSPFLQLDESSPTRSIMVILLHNSCVASTLASERGTPRNTVQKLGYWHRYPIVHHSNSQFPSTASMRHESILGMHVRLFARILTSCKMEYFIKFKLRIFGRPRKGYDPGFIHIILFFVPMIELEATTKALALLHDMESDACMFHYLKTWTITRG